jgi:hydroxymethylpyrimidine pyrophosphatase-like HAD family hydrolase
MMKWQALATDFDGTIASNGKVPEVTQAALRRLREEGRRVLLVTGRELPDFAGLDCPLTLFDFVVAENGALLHNPHTGTLRTLGTPPPPEFATKLAAFGATPLSVGACIVATREPFEIAALELIKEMGLEHQVIFNKGAVMILPPGINKAVGLAAALDELGLRPDEVVGVGDAENDHAFLEICGFGVAVANALPGLKERADFVTRAKAGAGVAELIEMMREGTIPEKAAKL